MSSPAGTVRHRGAAVAAPKKFKDTAVVPGQLTSKQKDIRDLDALVKANSKNGSSQWDYKLAITIITLLAFATRFWGISHPNEVVFDEVHFGKFASYYLERTYFFDVHPPFGKLLFALVGYLVGYDGSFHFDNIGDSYIENKVPYVAYRAMPALIGALTVPVVFDIMWESGYTLPACVVASGLVLFDNAHIGQTRLILLDATLVFAMACSLLAYIKFYKLRHIPFSRKWWKWLLITGFALSCVISTKYVGLFAFLTVGAAVAIDLWNLLDVNRRQGALSLVDFGKHFFARVFGLIIVPFLFYLFWFQVHFTILSRSGPGDDFMSPEFQETLSDNLMTASSKPIHYMDSIVLRHKDTKAYLHSHPDRYPLRYEDGRVSSQGQQVTGYPFNDTNNHWQIIPANRDNNPNRVVRNHELVQLRHLVTDSVLLSHDVASPYYPTNQEFTTVSMDDAVKRFNDTLFEIRIENGKHNQEFRTLASLVKIVHNPSKVCMWTHTKPLPEWAFKQQEINGNKNVAQTSNIWYVDDIPSLAPEDSRNQKTERKVKHVPFLKKWFELQRAMFAHNNALTSSHPYASQPFQWPFLLRGVSFWTQNDTRQQIYFLGNPLGWWIASSLLAVYAGIIGADQLSLRRGVDAMDRRTRNRLYNSTGFFFLAWALHYFPFYLMGRQLFLHHYLPAHIASCLVTGGLVEFIFNIEPLEIEDAAVSVAKSGTPQTMGTTGGEQFGGFGAAPNKKTVKKQGLPARESLAGQRLYGAWAAAVVILAVVIGGWYFFLPLTYGYPGLNVPEVNARKWLGYDLHFAK